MSTQIRRRHRPPLRRQRYHLAALPIVTQWRKLSCRGTSYSGVLTIGSRVLPSAAKPAVGVTAATRGCGAETQRRVAHAMESAG